VVVWSSLGYFVEDEVDEDEVDIPGVELDELGVGEFADEFVKVLGG